MELRLIATLEYDYPTQMSNGELKYEHHKENIFGTLKQLVSRLESLRKSGNIQNVVIKHRGKSIEIKA